MTNKVSYLARDIILCNKDFFKVSEALTDTIDLIITSPPYNLNIKYNSYLDLISYPQYLDFTEKWLNHCYRALKQSSGRICINIPVDTNLGQYRPIYADVLNIARTAGFKYKTTIIWNKGNISRRTAWGSWKSASSPHVIAPVETILVLYKNKWKKDKGDRLDDITKEEFIDWTYGLWTFKGQSKKGAGGHPAAFPVELARRCIKLFSFIGDTVLDPFVGSGSTLIAALLTHRRGIGIEIDKKYCKIAEQRIKEQKKR